MRPLSEYDVLIFDCDGVIFDSNRLKIEAMKTALEEQGSYSLKEVEICVAYFSNNFGMSRNHHVHHFVSELLELSAGSQQHAFASILQSYTDRCYDLYMKSALTPGFIELMDKVSVPCFVVSGSLEEELIRVFSARGIEHYFKGIYGSPKRKTEIVEGICGNYPFENIIMVGDAVSDFNAATDNGIDFLFYAPFSNVPAQMLQLSKEHGFPACYDYKTIDNR